MNALFKYVSLFLITLIIVAGLVIKLFFPETLSNLLKPVSVVSKVVADGQVKSTDGRTNILAIGIDSRTNAVHAVTSALTDSLMVISIDENGEKPVMISIPRDIWVDETESKINSVFIYTYVRERAKGDEEATRLAIEAVKSTVQEVVGIPIHYYVLVNFDVFESAIDTVGGIEVYVDETFEDFRYPIEGKEDAPESERYLHVRFEQGQQKMDGERALQYSRSRYSTNFNEQGDFARARRQQKVVSALKDKILSSEVLLDPSKIRELYDVYSQNVETNIAITDALSLFNKYKNVRAGDVSRIVLSNEPRDETLLGSGTLSSLSREEWEIKYKDTPFQYVLMPTTRTYDFIHAMIRTELFGN